jgi:DNA-directed RNA polymerase specialized sigma24 family protein
MTGEVLVENRIELEEDHVVFVTRFERCRHLLYLIAGRILGGNERIEDAVRHCFTTASRKPPKFRYEGAFRCWLLRVLIDEALLILIQERERINYV